MSHSELKANIENRLTNIYNALNPDHGFTFIDDDNIDRSDEKFSPECHSGWMINETVMASTFIGVELFSNTSMSRILDRYKLMISPDPKTSHAPTTPGLESAIQTAFKTERLKQVTTALMDLDSSDLLGYIPVDIVYDHYAEVDINGVSLMGWLRTFISTDKTHGVTITVLLNREAFNADGSCIV